MIFENKITDNKTAFLEKVKLISKRLDINPEWLMAAMFIESNFKNSAVNEIGAIGLIQFLPSTYTGMGYSKNEMITMSNVEQLNVVYKFLKPFSGKIKSYTDLHTVIFFPKATEFKDNQPFEYGSLTAEKVALANKQIDLNSDKQITKKEFAEFLQQRFETNSDLTKNEINRLFDKGIYSKEAKLITLSLVFIGGLYASYLNLKNK